MTLEQLYKALGRSMEDRDARFLIEHHTGLSWSDIIACPDFGLSKDKSDAIQKDAARYSAGEPLSRILGEREFWGLRFEISPETLDPRPDTEALVERALDHFKNSPPEWILDLGTGSGCIIISLLREWLDSRAVAVDLSLHALKTAQKNAANHNVLDRIGLVCGSWADSLGQNFDLIVSNPPYIKSSDIPNLEENVRNHDPVLALDGGNNGTESYKNIFPALPERLKAGGRAFFEIGYNQENDIERLSKQYRIRIENIFPDYAGNPRVVDISCGDK